MAAAAGRKVAVAAVQFACTDVEAENVATAERYAIARPPARGPPTSLVNPRHRFPPQGTKIVAVVAVSQTLKFAGVVVMPTSYPAQ